MDETQINTSAIAQYAISYTRPTAAQVNITPEDQSERERKAIEILVNGNIVDAMNADPQYY